MWPEHLIINILNSAMPHPSIRGSQQGLHLGRAQRIDGRHEEVYLSDQRRTEHIGVVGKTGSGKTNFLEYLAVQHIENGEGFIFFDFHGDATAHLMQAAAANAAADERLVLVDLSDPIRSPGINPLEPVPGSSSVASNSSELATILRQRWQVDSFGARTEELLRNTLHALSETGHTLVEVPLLLSSDAFRNSMVKRLSNPEVRDYFTQRYDPLSEAMKATFREPLLNKITEFISEPACRHFLGQAQSSIKLADCIEEGKWVLVSLPKGVLRHHALTLANLICAHLLFTILARVRLPEGKRRLFTIFCDEVQNIAQNDLITLFAEGRKFGTSLITANQFFEQLQKELRGAMLSAGTLALFRISATDSSVLGKELNSRGRLPARPDELSRGQMVVRTGAQAPALVSVPKVKLPDVSAADVAALRERVLAIHCRSRLSIEQSIKATHDIASGAEPDGSVIEPAPGEGQLDW